MNLRLREFSNKNRNMNIIHRNQYFFSKQDRSILPATFRTSDVTFLRHVSHLTWPSCRLAWSTYWSSTDSSLHDVITEDSCSRKNNCSCSSKKNRTLPFGVMVREDMTAPDRQHVNPNDAPQSTHHTTLVCLVSLWHQRVPIYLPTYVVCVVWQSHSHRRGMESQNQFDWIPLSQFYGSIPIQHSNHHTIPNPITNNI